MAIRIIGTGSFAPERILTNEELEKMVDTSDEWITTRTGIRQRHIADEDVATSDLACKAALQALDAAGIKPEQLGLISVASVSNDKIFPSTSCILQEKIGAKNCACYDIQAACSGLIYSMELAIAMLRAYSKKYKYALVVGAEKFSSLIDWSDRTTCVLFGDGATALVLESDETLPDSEDMYIDSEIGADGSHAYILDVPAGGTAMPTTPETLANGLNFIKMGGKETFKLAVNNMVAACRNTLEKAGYTAEQVSWVVAHQANKRIIDAVASRLGVEEERVYVNVDRYGNTSAASIGICLDEMARGGMLKRGDIVLMTAFGAGMTWGAMLIRW